VLTRCPSCATHFRVTPEQLKARAGRVRCGECQNVFNALDTLIEEPLAASAPTADVGVAPAPTIEELSDWPPEAGESFSSALTASPAVEASAALIARGAKTAEASPATESAAVAVNAEPDDWSADFAEPPPAPRRWPWVVGSLVALIALGLQAVLAFRVELSVLWPESKPKLVALCNAVGCEVGFPARIALVGIEASDLHPDSERKGRLALSAILKNRAPFAQQYPHLELTLTDTADKAIARKVLTPADYLPPKTPSSSGMPPNADIAVIVGVDSGELAASGYRLYVFYP
jgi:predicted Zn finger-like uncharacterized protein